MGKLHNHFLKPSDTYQARVFRCVPFLFIKIILASKKKVIYVLVVWVKLYALCAIGTPVCKVDTNNT